MSVAVPNLGEKKQNWGTPQHLVDQWVLEYGLNLDVCAEPWNAKLPVYITEEMDGLKSEWGTEDTKTREMAPLYTMGSPKPRLMALGRSIPAIAYCNPPYSQTGKWLDKALEEAKRRVSTVMLVPASTGTNWFYKAMQNCGVWFFLQRIKFVNPPGMTAEEIKKKSPTFSPALIEVNFRKGPPYTGFLGYRCAKTGKVLWRP